MRCRDCKSVWRDPRVRQLRQADSIFIPSLTLAAVKPTVLNCFLFRQTDLIPGLAGGEDTSSLDFNQQRSAWKMKTRFSFRWHHKVDSKEFSGLPK